MVSGCFLADCGSNALTRAVVGSKAAVTGDAEDGSNAIYITS
jgi:hypothetical protein